MLNKIEYLCEKFVIPVVIFTNTYNFEGKLHEIE